MAFPPVRFQYVVPVLRVFCFSTDEGVKKDLNNVINSCWRATRKSSTLQNMKHGTVYSLEPTFTTTIA